MLQISNSKYGREAIINRLVWVAPEVTFEQGFEDMREQAM